MTSMMNVTMWLKLGSLMVRGANLEREEGGKGEREEGGKGESEREGGRERREEGGGRGRGRGRERERGREGEGERGRERESTCKPQLAMLTECCYHKKLKSTQCMYQLTSYHHYHHTST